MENFQIQKKVKKVKMLTVPLTPDEHNAIKQYCIEQNVTLTSLVRYAIKTTYNINTL
jgi:hypothetical protein